MVNNRRREIVQHDNEHDMEKIEFNLSEISVNIDKRLLNKMNRQNKKWR